MKRSTCSVLLVFVAGLIPVHAGAVTFQQTTVTTSTVGQPNGTSGGSIFNPFPLLGGSAPLATSPTTFNPSPIIGNAPPTPATGISLFNPFPLTGGAAPLAAPVQPFTSTTVGTSAPLVPNGVGGAARPAAQNSSAVNAVTGAGTTTTTGATNTTSGTSPSFQSTVTTILPLSLSLTAPSPTAASSATAVSTNAVISPAITLPSSTGITLALIAADTSAPTTKLVQNPEPSTLVLFASGFAALAWYGRKKRRAVENPMRRKPEAVRMPGMLEGCN